jgi:hypothetical protein
LRLLMLNWLLNNCSRDTDERRATRSRTLMVVGLTTLLDGCWVAVLFGSDTCCSCVETLGAWVEDEKIESIQNERKNWKMSQNLKKVLQWRELRLQRIVLRLQVRIFRLELLKCHFTRLKQQSNRT